MVSVKIIKLGGSVITRKEEYRRARPDLISQLCSRFKDRGDIVLVHGAGSFGHILALRNGLETPGRINGKQEAVARVTYDVSYLNNIVIKTLIKSGVPAVGIPPHSIYPDEIRDFSTVKHYLESGIVPVLYGDVIVENRQFRIISGDQIILDLSRVFGPDEVAFLSDVDGLYTADPKLDPGARLIRRIRSNELNIEGKGSDATGSMAGKIRNIREIMKYTKRVVIINGNYPERLESFLRGKRFIGTVIT